MPPQLEAAPRRDAATPRVTVLLPVYDAEPYVREAVRSILGQTFRDLELLAIDDGSHDRSRAMVEAMRDPRIRLHTHERNRGLVATLNEGLDLARGAYVARMDADDVAHPARLERQVRWLDAHPEVAALGTAVRNFGEVRNSWTLKSEPAEVRARLLFECALCHPTVMLRAAALRRHGLRYETAYRHAEDWALWVAIAEKEAVANLPERLLRYRTHARQVSKTENLGQLLTIRRIFAAQLARLGIDATEADLELHERIASGAFAASPGFLDAADAWLRRIDAAARRLPAPHAGALAAEAAFRWARVCRRSRRLGLAALRRFRASPLHREAPAATKLQVALGALAGSLSPRDDVRSP